MGKHLDHARILLSDQSRPDLAEKELRQELADDPDNGFAHAMLGHALGRQNKNQQGLAEVQKAIGLRPDLDYCHNILAWLLIRLGRFHEALIAIQEAIRLKPNEPDHFQLLSVVLSELNLDQEALEVAEQGLRLNPRNVECLNRRAFALAKLGREKEAEVTFQSALALQPLSNLTYSHLGWFFLGRCCVQRAVESLEEALRIAPNDPYSRNLMLTALRERLTEIHFGLSARYFLVPMLVASCVIWIFGGVESMIAVLVFLPFCFFAVYLPFAVIIRDRAPEAIVIRLARLWRLPFLDRQKELWKWFGSGLLPGAAGIAEWGFTHALVPSLGVFLAGMAAWTLIACFRLSGEISKKDFILDTFMGAFIGLIALAWGHFLAEKTHSPYLLAFAYIPNYIWSIYRLALLRSIAGSGGSQESSPAVG